MSYNLIIFISFYITIYIYIVRNLRQPLLFCTVPSGGDRDKAITVFCIQPLIVVLYIQWTRGYCILLAFPLCLHLMNFQTWSDHLTTIPKGKIHVKKRKCALSWSESCLVMLIIGLCLFNFNLKKQQQSGLKSLWKCHLCVPMCKIWLCSCNLAIQGTVSLLFVPLVGWLRCSQTWRDKNFRSRHELKRR